MLKYDFIGMLDADISFEPNYYESVLAKFQQNPRLGVAGGVLFDFCGERKVHRFSSPWSVSGGIQFFRRKCYEDIGGYLPLTRGGIDTVAEVMARMHGWEVRSFPDIRGLHHRRTGTAKDNIYVAKFNAGLRAYSNGSHPLFEVFKCLRRVKDKPYLIGSLLIMSGFVWAFCRGEKKILSEEFVAYRRKEQIQRLRSFFKRVWLLK
jgi:GT2 family glycosyltransferase